MLDWRLSAAVAELLVVQFPELPPLEPLQVPRDSGSRTGMLSVRRNSRIPVVKQMRSSPVWKVLGLIRLLVLLWSPAGSAADNNNQGMLEGRVSIPKRSHAIGSRHTGAQRVAP